MKYGRVYNFSAGPAMMPESVLEEIRDEMMNYKGSGMCVMEMSHRSKVFQKIFDDTQAKFRKLMNVPEGYKILFLQVTHFVFERIDQLLEKCIAPIIACNTHIYFVRALRLLLCAGAQKLSADTADHPRRQNFSDLHSIPLISRFHPAGPLLKSHFYWLIVKRSS